MATNFYQKNKSKQKVLHYPTEIRSRFYQLVSSGNLQEVEAFLEKKDFRKLCDSNVLSETSVQNMRYHFIVTVTMLTHFCIQAGMPEVQAFDIQDNYIQSADQTHRLVDMEALHDEACMEYALKMKRLQKQDISSKHIAICINYIHQNIRKKLSVPDIAEYLQLHPSYLSSVSWNSGISESIFQLHVPRQPEPSAHQRPDRWFLNLQQRLFCPCPERISGCFLPDGQYTIISAYRFDFSKQIIFS